MVPLWPQLPALESAEVSLSSHLVWQALKPPGLMTSFAAQPSSQLAPLPTAFAEAEGHFPLPGTSPDKVATQLSARPSMLPSVPAQPEVFAKAAENLSDAFKRQLPSTVSFLALAFE